MDDKKAKKKKIIKRIIIGLVIFAAVNYVAYLGIASPIMMNVLKNKGINKDTSKEAMTSYIVDDCGFDLDAFLNTYTIEELTLTSNECKESHDIPVYYIYAQGVETKDAPTVVMAHGMSASHICTYPYAEIFLKRGFNVITYDQHSFGENPEEYVSYGYYESKDFLACLQYVVDNQTGDNIIGSWGQSMGGATIENAMDTELVNNNMDFIVLDCPMGGIAEVTHADPVHNATTSLLNKIVMGYSFGDQSPYSQVEECAVPVMIVVAGNDAAVSEDSYNKTEKAIGLTGKEFTYVGSKSAHAKVFYDDPEGYEDALDVFFKDTVGIEE